MDDRSRRRNGTGLLGCGGGALLAVVAVGGLGALLFRSCELTLATGDLGPGEGVKSTRLPVEVTPRTGLVDGSVVTVSSEAFGAHRVVGVAVCLEEADTESAGVDACDEVTGARYAVGGDGRLSATYPVPRVVTVGSRPHDCAAPGTSCIVVAADASDYDLSGGRRISYRTDLGAPDLVARTVRPNSDLLPVLPPSFRGLANGAVVEVTASGFQPGEPVLLAHCAGFPDRPAIGSCDPVDDQAFTAILGRNVRGVTRRADATGTARHEFTAIRYPDRFTFGGDGDGGEEDDGEYEVDCADPADACAFVISAAADTKRSAVAPYVVSP